MFEETDKLTLKFIWKCKGPGILKTILKKIKKEETLPNFKTYYKSKIIKTVLDWHTNRRIDQPLKNFLNI